MKQASSRLLINEQPLQTLPTLAKNLGLNRAVILQQIQYWLCVSPHEIDGYSWIYNSYTEWSKQFPWLTPRGVRFHIKGLEDEGYLIAGNYNKDSRDNTKWYRINYDRLEALLISSGGVSQNVTRELPKTTLASVENYKPLPKNTSKNTTKEKKNIYGQFNNIQLTDAEIAKLKEKVGAETACDYIEQLSIGKEARGYKYKSDYAAILNWLRRDSTIKKANGLPTEEDLVAEAKAKGLK